MSTPTPPNLSHDLSPSLSPSLSGASWLKEPDTQKIMQTLGQDAVRVVGGCVRDALRGLDVTDIDMATTHPPEDVRDKLTAAGFKVIPTGIAHGTVTVVASERHYEITTLREDIETDGRHAKVRFGQDWQADAERRDFTVNALYADCDGTVFDPLAACGTSGLADLEEQVVRFIGNPDTRIAEDYLRVLRFFRFSAHLQSDAPDDASLKACARAATQKEGLLALSGERLAQEIFKLLAHPNAPQALELMQQAGLLPFIFPFMPAMDVQNNRLASLIDIQATQFFEADTLLRLAALCPDNKAVVNQLSEKLRLSKKQTQRLTGALDASHQPVCYMSARDMRRMLYVLGREAFIDRCFLIWAMDEKTNNAVQWRALIAMATSWAKPDFPLTGAMMKTAGVPEGPEMGRVSAEVERWWIDSDFTDDMFSIIERLKAVVQATIL
ncbi:hypothetical protein IMCC14465_14140 [alpha proteobacterium IMCC14465]|uniref:CCA tRNA nucleotidyltransferase n=1 Tax=alpha proteobacterium IMCC14465 TaxID=1220535 RepID=J9DHP5_9PROT|nr:hypothetical protein IMCC14465_14140 [alpha proteobacterium IMCC14465]